MDIMSLYMAKYAGDPVYHMANHRASIILDAQRKADSGLIVEDGNPKITQRVSPMQDILSMVSGSSVMGVSDALDHIHLALCRDVEVRFFSSLSRETAKKAVQMLALMCDEGFDPESSFTLAQTSSGSGKNPLSYTASDFCWAWNRCHPEEPEI